MCSLSCSDWIQIIIALMMLGGTVMSFISIREMKRQTAYTIMKDLHDYRYNNAFFESKIQLTKWYKDHATLQENGMDGHKNDLIQEALTTGVGKSYRHHFVVYFQMIHDRFNSKIVSNDDLRILTNAVDMRILFEIVKPLEEALRIRIGLYPLPIEMFEFFQKKMDEGYIEQYKKK